MIDHQKPIILIGFKHAGKTVLGAALAKKLKLDFTDLDDEIQKQYLNHSGESLNCRQIARKHGLDYFRALESQSLVDVLKLKPSILSVGGGTPLSASNREIMSHGTVI